MKKVILGLAVLLSGCAATAPQYYSLQAPAIASPQPKPRLAGDFVISVQPVLIPEALSRPQIVVASEAGAEVIPLNAALWAGPLEAQIRDALAASLSARLNVLDIGLAKPEGTPVWRIYVDVQRFDSLYGQEVRQDLVWRLEPHGVSPKAAKRVCAAQLRLPVEEGMSALVAGHRRSLEILAGVIAHTLPPAGKAAQSAGSKPVVDGLSFRGCVG